MKNIVLSSNYKILNIPFIDHDDLPNNVQNSLFFAYNKRFAKICLNTSQNAKKCAVPSGLFLVGIC